jgi:excisionase family DNA binding protein
VFYYVFQQKGSKMEILDMKEACEFLRVSKPSLYKYIRSGEIPAFKMGRVWRFDKGLLDGWVKNKVQQDTQARSAKE